MIKFCSKGVNTLKINLVDILKSLPMHNWKNKGLTISYSDIYNVVESLVLDNKTILNYELRKLSDAGVIELLSDESFDKNLCFAVKFK